jgi:hypothetical protein
MIYKRPDGVVVDVYPDQKSSGYLPGAFGFSTEMPVQRLKL